MKNDLSNLAIELESRIRKEVVKYKGVPATLSGGLDSSLLAALVKPEFVVSVELPAGKHNEIEYAKCVVKHLGIKHIIIEPDANKFDEYFENAVRAIGRPIPHFNIFPLYCMYKQLAEMGVKQLILGDGPDETMCGYARDLILIYLFSILNYEAFVGYDPIINKVLPGFFSSCASIFGKSLEEIKSCVVDDEGMVKTINRINIKLMRPDMDDMSNNIAKSFGITNIRPYQDNPELDNFMLNLPVEAKIYKVEYGKYLLRKIAEKYIPKEIAWRKIKVGGPVYPVNVLKGWMQFGEFDKRIYLQKQKEILNEQKMYS
jgi:asparagine synthase (glutamine-hydrolysing)